MRNLFFPVLICAIFLLNSADSEIKKTQTFYDEKNKFSFQYPSGWKKKYEGRQVYFESPDLAVRVYYMMREVEAGKSAYQQVESFFAEIGTANEWSVKRSEVNPQQLALWGASEGSYGYGTRMVQQEIHFYAALAIKKNQCYILEAQLLKSKDQKYKSIISEIFKTIRIEK